VRRRAGLTPAMVPDLCRQVLWRASAPLRIAWRRNWIYRQFLKGRMPDRICHHPFDARPRRLEEADALLKGRFRFGGETVDVKDGSVFDCAPPSLAWAGAVHGFDWLASLSSAGGECARNLGIRLVDEWLSRYGRYGEPAWSSEIIARRLIQIFAHGRFIIANSDMLWRSKLFVSLREQAGQLGRIASEAPEGLPRLEAAVADLLSCVCLNDTPGRLEPALLRIEAELAAQILPDGGHLSRSPDDLVEAYRQVVMAVDALTAVSAEVPPGMRSAQDRMAPMLRFFRLGDGALAGFNGGGECDARMIAALLARDEVRGQPFLHAPHSGYQRLVAARSIAIMDCGAPPPGPFSTRAHAGCLAFEFGTGGQRLVVNCGSGKTETERWNGALRATAAQSTVTLADTSMASILSNGIARELLGPRLVANSAPVESERRETPHGWRVEAYHDFYLAKFGIRHQRELTLSRQGTKLTGCDRLLRSRERSRRGTVPFAVRFHIHPDVRISPSHRGDILLKLPNGEGWRFRHGGDVSVEESVYVGHGGVRRTGQLVLAGTARDESVEAAWVFEQIGAE
jgi:uncharacterized heparinase superfamily protein